jgi:hypothetical protein
MFKGRASATSRRGTWKLIYYEAKKLSRQTPASFDRVSISFYADTHVLNKPEIAVKSPLDLSS